MSTEKNNKLVPFLEKEFGPLSFSSFMRAARSSLGLTQVEMARRLKITAGTLCDIEKGRQLVSLRLAKKIAALSGLSVPIAIEAAMQDQLRKAGLTYKIKII